jgi:hypothetical protein
MCFKSDFAKEIGQISSVIDGLTYREDTFAIALEN